MHKAHFFSTFEHELTHLLVGLLFFKKPENFNVTANQGGNVSLHGNNFLISLAPYFLPTFSLLFLFIIVLINVCKNKTAKSTADFMDKINDFYPFTIKIS